MFSFLSATIIIRRAVVAGCLLMVSDVWARDVDLRWQDTLVQEHHDRRARLERISARSLQASPRFYEALISKTELPAAFGVDVPILRVVYPQRAFFDTAQDDLRPDAERIIDDVAAALKGDPSDTAVFIAGHTDDRGPISYNYNLSVRRAETVGAALLKRGVKTLHIWRIGFGPAIPLEDNVSSENMARNRRVEFLFGRKPEAVAKWLADQKAVACGAAEASKRDACDRAFGMLDRLEARPITIRRRPDPPPIDAAISPVDPAGLVPIRPQATAIAKPVPAGATVVSPTTDAPRIVTIKPDDAVVIDMHQQEVLVRRFN